MTKDETGRLFKYDAWDHLVAQVNTSGADLIRYTVDGRGYRVQRIVPGQTINYFYDEDWQLVEEKIDGGATQATYVWGLGYPDALVARDTPANGRQFSQFDANYNVTSVAGSTGTVQERYIYDPYGTVTYKTATWGVRGSSSYGWVYLHQGGRLDSGTGLYHFRNRDYSATLGRWIQQDPVGYVDGLSLYEYVGNSPIVLYDPFGLAKAPPGGPPNYGKGGRWTPYKNGQCKDPKGHTWRWHDSDDDKPGRRHKDHWDVADKKGKKTRRDPLTGEDMGRAIDDARNEQEKKEIEEMERQQDECLDKVGRFPILPLLDPRNWPNPFAPPRHHHHHD